MALGVASTDSDLLAVSERPLVPVRRDALVEMEGDAEFSNNVNVASRVWLAVHGDTPTDRLLLNDSVTLSLTVFEKSTEQFSGKSSGLMAGQNPFPCNMRIVVLLTTSTFPQRLIADERAV